MKLGTRASRAPRVAHFTDTFHDMNGVAITLRKVATLAQRHQKDNTFITCHSGATVAGEKAFQPLEVYSLPEFRRSNSCCRPHWRYSIIATSTTTRISTLRPQDNLRKSVNYPYLSKRGVYNTSYCDLFAVRIFFDSGLHVHFVNRNDGGSVTTMNRSMVGTKLKIAFWFVLAVLGGWERTRVRGSKVPIQPTSSTLQELPQGCPRGDSNA